MSKSCWAAFSSLGGFKAAIAVPAALKSFSHNAEFTASAFEFIVPFLKSAIACCMELTPVWTSWKNGRPAMKSFDVYERRALARETRPQTNIAIHNASTAKTTAAVRRNHVRRMSGVLRGSIFGFGAPGAAPLFARGLLFVATGSPLEAVLDHQDG